MVFIFVRPVTFEGKASLLPLLTASESREIAAVFSSITQISFIFTGILTHDFVRLRKYVIYWIRNVSYFLAPSNSDIKFNPHIVVHLFEHSLTLRV